MPSSMTTLSASTAEGKLPRLLEGGWANKDQATEGQKVLLGMDEPIVLDLSCREAHSLCQGTISASALEAAPCSQSAV
eukprot:228075-Amphidinium_carterae.2